MTVRISVSEAKGQLTQLVKRAEAGEEVILMRRGQEVARLTPVAAPPSGARRRALMDRVRAAAAEKLRAGPGAARSQDFLYDDDGLPA